MNFLKLSTGNKNHFWNCDVKNFKRQLVIRKRIIKYLDKELDS